MGLFNRFKRSAHGGGENGDGVAGGETTTSFAGSSHDNDEAGEKQKQKKQKSRRKSFFQLISPSDVTTESLQVWAGLPQKIRQDPSMASFQMECDRLHGKIRIEAIIVGDKLFFYFRGRRTGHSS